MDLNKYFTIEKIDENRVTLTSRNGLPYTVVEKAVSNLFDNFDEKKSVAFTNLFYDKMLEAIVLDYFIKNMQIKEELIVTIDNNIVVSIGMLQDKNNSGYVANLTLKN